MVSLSELNFSLPRLVKLSLKKNKLIDLKGLENFTNLNYLKLSRNNIEGLVEIKRLSLLPNLKGVSLYRNPINEDKRLYVTLILSVCKNLESLDHTNVEEIRKKYNLDATVEAEVQFPEETRQKPKLSREDKRSIVEGRGSQSPSSKHRRLLSRGKTNSNGGSVKGGTKNLSKSPKSRKSRSRPKPLLEGSKLLNRNIEKMRAEVRMEEQVEPEFSDEEEDSPELDPRSLEAVKRAFAKKLKKKTTVRI